MRLKNSLLIIFILTSFSAFGQLENQLGLLTSEDVKLYAKPFVTATGTAFNSGIIRSANIPKDFGFSVSVNAIYIIIPEDQKTFLPTSLDPAKGYDNTKKVSTIFGPNQSTVFSGSDGLIGFPGGFDVPHSTFIVPQIAFHAYHTELILRIVPSVTIVDKKLSFLGAGLRHSIGQYIELPVDISAHGFYNGFNIDDIASSSNIAFGVAVSKTFNMFTPYAGLQFESSQISFDYKRTESGQQLDVNTKVKGDNVVKFTLGSEFRYGVFALNLDFNFGNQNNAAAGIAFNF
ncbi:MAG: DUF6588 family protein [Ignavibacteriaceae bacterium]